MPTALEKRTWSLAARLPLVEEDGTSRSLTAKDANTCVEFTNAGAITATVEELSGSAGISMLLKRGSASGIVTIAAGSGVTLESGSGNFDIANASGVVTLYWLTDSRAVIAGDL